MPQTHHSPSVVQRRSGSSPVQRSAADTLADPLSDPLSDSLSDPLDVQFNEGGGMMDEFETDESNGDGGEEEWGFEEDQGWDQAEDGSWDYDDGQEHDDWGDDGDGAGISEEVSGADGDGTGAGADVCAEENQEVSESPGTHEEAEVLYDRAVEAGNYHEALNIVVYSNGYGGPNIQSISYDGALGYSGLTSGGYGSPCIITIGPAAFTAGMAYCSSVVSHECQHANQRSAKDPMQCENDQPASECSRAMREFMAYSYTVLDDPNRFLLSAEDCKANAVQAMKNFNKMSQYEQIPLMERHEKVRRVYNSNGKVT